MRTRYSLIAATLAILLCTTFVFAQAPTAPPKPGPEVKKMGAVIGKWATEGEMKPFPPMPGGKFTGTRSCSWTAGGFGVSCTETGTMAGGKSTAISLMAYDPEAKNYVYTEVDTQGQVIVSRGTINGDTWVFEGDAPMMGKPMHNRFTIAYTGKDSCTLKYEMGPDANSMQPMMEGKQKRVMAPAAPKPATK